MSETEQLYEEIKTLVPKVVPDPDAAFDLMRRVIMYGTACSLEANAKSHAAAMRIIRETLNKPCDTPSSSPSS